MTTDPRPKHGGSRAHLGPSILAVGIALRIVFCAGNDVRHVHDDHWHVIRIIVEERRLPGPTEGWECYQPPLYYLLGAGVYSAARPVARTAGLADEEADAAGRKAIQFISAVAGCLTLLVVWLCLKDLLPGQPGLQAVGLATAAFLPRHVYMSGMATNDALAYLWMTAAVWALLKWRAADWSARWALLAGLACGVALLTKPYGLATLAVVLLATAAAVFARSEPAQSGPTAGGRFLRGALMVTLAVGVGFWPYWRNWRACGSPFVSNYDILDHTIWFQPPGRFEDVSLTSFRLPALLDRPWLHVSTLDSFWTALYAEAWFDHGTMLTIFHYRPFVRHIARTWRDDSKTPAERYHARMDWDTDDVPASELAEARALLILGLLPTGLLVVGLLASLGGAGGGYVSSVLLANLLANLAIPLYQTFRQPHYSSMKATFCLGMLVSGAAFCAWGARWLGWSRRRWPPRVIAAALATLAMVLAVHLVHVAFFPPDYFLPPQMCRDHEPPR